ncbi:MAG: HPr family phosphocarrier protein [Gammaproteobacteria bacterium]|nr:HPr family phosphocarrier protein [Gammaproteobacteria bacterium]
MKTRDVTICNRLGLHARAATRLVNCAAEFEAEVWIVRGSRRINGKSIMGVLTLAAAKGTELRIEADGPDEDEALDALNCLVEDRFGEED